MKCGRDLAWATFVTKRRSNIAIQCKYWSIIGPLADELPGKTVGSSIDSIAFMDADFQIVAVKMVLLVCE